MHVTSIANVETTLNTWFTGELQALELPAYLPTISYVYEWPQITANLPCFSFNHNPVGVYANYQGNVENDALSVMKAHGILEVNAWVSRDQKYNGQDVWRARLNTMRQMVIDVRNKHSVVTLQDSQTSPDYPIEVNYKIDLGDITTPQIGRDINPAIERCRMLINYHWHSRVEI